MNSYFAPIRTTLMVLALLGAAGAADAQQTIEFRADQRTPVLVNRDDKGKVTLDNIRFGFDDPARAAVTPKWRKATIDTGAVKDVVFVIKPFQPEWLAAHVFMYFTFDEAHPVRSEYGETSTGLVLSVEAYLKVGQHYDIIRGFFGDFRIVYDMSTWEDYVQESSLHDQRLLRYSLKLSDQQRKQLLANAITAALKDRTNELYHSSRNSCATSLVDVINTVLPKEQQIAQWWIPNALKNPWTSMPRFYKMLLERHHLIAGTLPVVVPSKENRVDLATKPFTGAALADAQKKLAAVEEAVGATRSLMQEALGEGQIGPDALESLLYDAGSESVPWFYVPGVVPEERNNGEYRVGSEFQAQLKAGGPSGMLGAYETSASGYIDAIRNRMVLEGPDISSLLIEREKLLQHNLKSMIFAAR